MLLLLLSSIILSHPHLSLGSFFPTVNRPPELLNQSVTAIQTSNNKIVPADNYQGGGLSFQPQPSTTQTVDAVASQQYQQFQINGNPQPQQLGSALMVPTQPGEGNFLYSSTASEASYSACPTPVPPGANFYAPSVSPAPSTASATFQYYQETSVGAGRSVQNAPVPVTVPGWEPLSGEFGFGINFDSLADGKQTKSKEWTYSPVLKKLFCR